MAAGASMTSSLAKCLRPSTARTAMAKRKKKKLNPKADAPVASTSKIADETAPAVAATA